MAATILVLEDDLNLLQEVLESLEDLSFEAHGAPNPEKAIELARRNKYDLMITDIRMAGGMDGVACLREIRRFHPDLPCIVMTGFSDDEPAVRAAKSQIQAYLKKPFGLKELLNTINLALDARRDEPVYQRVFEGIKKIFRQNPAAAEAQRAALKSQVEAKRHEIYSTFCSALQMERFLSRERALDLFDQLENLESHWFKFEELEPQRAQQMLDAYARFEHHLHTSVERKLAGSHRQRKPEELNRQKFYQLCQRIEKRLVMPQELAYAWWVYKMPAEVRLKHPKAEELFQLLWGEPPRAESAVTGLLARLRAVEFRT